MIREFTTLARNSNFSLRNGAEEFLREMKKICKEGYDSLNAQRIRPFPTTPSGNKYQLKEMVDMGRIRCIYIFRVPACLELLVLRNVWKLVLAALYA